MTNNRTRHLGIAILGAGFAGVGMAARLILSGRTDFRVFERADGIGGTWWVNRYPGCACDVPSHLYSLSFAPNPDWTRRFAPRAEIQRYLEAVVDDHGFRDRIELNAGIESATWQEQERHWKLVDDRGRCWTAEVLVSAIGGLSRPKWPDIPGLDAFGGPVFHSQQWSESVDLAGRRVAVIGTGASAAQFVPEVARQASRLDVYQRTPHWVLPRPDAAIPRWMRRVYRRAPWLQKLARFGVWLVSESHVPALTRGTRLSAGHRWLANRHRRRQIQDPELAGRLEPGFEIGCKRVILSSEFYPAIARDNVELIDAGIERIEADAVIDRNGRRRPTDVVILGTGFRATDPLPQGVVTGRGGVDLARRWSDGPSAWRGVAVSGFPNFFMLMGPNTALGHNSVILMIEAQIGFILRALDYRDRSDTAVLEIEAGEQRRYNRWLAQRLDRTVWNGGGCSSWYLHPESGKNTTLWPGYTWRYRRLMRRFDPSVFRTAEG